MISPCCHAPLYVASSRHQYFGDHWNENPEDVKGTTFWYACTVCEKACDPVRE